MRTPRTDLRSRPRSRSRWPRLPTRGLRRRGSSDGSRPTMLQLGPERVLNGSPSRRGRAAILMWMLAPRLVILEDEQRLRDVLVRSLRAEGFDASAYATGRELLAP